MASIQLLILAIIFTVAAKGEEIHQSTKRIVCYRSNFWYHNNNVGCTHVVYSIAKVEWSSAYMNVSDYIFNAEPNMTVLIGLDTINSNSFPQVISSNVGRKRLTRSVVEYLQSTNVSGVDVKISDKYLYETQLLIQDLRAEANRYGFMLTAVLSLSSNFGYGNDSMNDTLASIVRDVDFLSIQLFYISGYRNGTKLASPLYSDTSESLSNLIDYFLSLEVSRSKITLGIPGFASCYVLRNADQNYIGARTGYFSININGTYCEEKVDLINVTDSDWVIQRANDSSAPYATWYLAWISYDDEVSVKEKVDYINENKLGGAMVWARDNYPSEKTLPFVDILQKWLS